MNAPSHLGVEHLGDVRPRPRRAPPAPFVAAAADGATAQEAYAIEIDGRDPGRIESEDCVLVPWPGDTLASRQRVVWRVKVWTDGGESDWSDTGLVRDGPARARRLGRPLDRTDGDRAIRPRAAPFASGSPRRLRHEPGSTPRRTASTRRSSTAGVSATSSWRRAYTSYPTTLHVQVYDVGDLLVAGENTWEVVLSDGWWRGRTGFFQLPDGYGSTLAFLGQLHADDVVVTDGPRMGVGHRAAPARRPHGGAESRTTGPRPSAWQPVSVVDDDLDRLAYSPAPPTRRVRGAPSGRRDPSRAPIARSSTSGRTSTAGCG